MITGADRDPEMRRKSELFQCYRRGWKHGVCNNAQDKRFVEHSRTEIGQAYLRGYGDGRDAWLLVSFRECERLGYDPRVSILRAQAPAEPPSSDTEATPKGANGAATDES